MRLLNEALGTLPSIAESTDREPDEGELDEASALTILNDAIDGRPAHVVDKSRLRYVLYRSGRSQAVLGLTLKLLPRHPEHIDAFATFLQNYEKSSRIMRHIKAMLQGGVLYDYVQGELWLIAARIGRPEELRELLPSARSQSLCKKLSFSMRRGLLAFLHDMPNRRRLFSVQSSKSDFGPRLHSSSRSRYRTLPMPISDRMQSWSI